MAEPATEAIEVVARGAAHGPSPLAADDAAIERLRRQVGAQIAQRNEPRTIGYLIDARDGRGRMLHLRHDGDHGLVEPA